MPSTDASTAAGTPSGPASEPYPVAAPGRAAPDAPSAPAPGSGPSSDPGRVADPESASDPASTPTSALASTPARPSVSAAGPGRAPEPAPTHASDAVGECRPTRESAPAAHPARPAESLSTVGDCEDTLDIRLPVTFPMSPSAPRHPRRTAADTNPETDTADPAGGNLLDQPGTWGPVRTPVGVLHLLPVRVERDLPLISRWMNDPAVAAFWRLDGPESVAEAHLRRLSGGDGRSVPCLGHLDGVPMSYWEVYRADLDPLARHYPARPHDTGLHLLIGGVADRGRGTGTALLRAVADLVLDRRRSCSRVIAEPDLRNTPSVSAFLGAGFRFSAEVDLPDKRAALMVRDRRLRDVL